MPSTRHHRVPLLFLVPTSARQSGTSSIFIDRRSPPCPVTMSRGEYSAHILDPARHRATSKLLLAKGTSPSDDAAQRAAFAEGAAVYELASSFLYAGPPDQYQQDVSKVQADVLRITAEKDQTKLLHLLRNCADLSNSTMVANAVADLLEDDEPDYIKPLGRVSPRP